MTHWFNISKRIMSLLCEWEAFQFQLCDYRRQQKRWKLYFPLTQVPSVFVFSRVTPQETTVKHCWCSAEGKIKPVTSLQLWKKPREDPDPTVKLWWLASVSVVTVPNCCHSSAKPRDLWPPSRQSQCFSTHVWSTCPAGWCLSFFLFLQSHI